MYTGINEDAKRRLMRNVASDLVYYRFQSIFYDEIKEGGGEVRLYELIDALESVTRRNKQFTREDIEIIFISTIERIKKYLMRRGWKIQYKSGCKCFPENWSYLVLKY